KRYVRRNSRWRSWRRFRICACTDTSSADTGSSGTTRRGRRASAGAVGVRGPVGGGQTGAQGERAGDADALALAAAEGVREAAHVLGPEPHAAHEIGHALLALPPAPNAADIT